MRGEHVYGSEITAPCVQDVCCDRSLAAQTQEGNFEPTLALLPMEAFLCLLDYWQEDVSLGCAYIYHAIIPCFPNLPDSKLPDIRSINWKGKSQSVLDVLISGGACSSESSSRCPENL